MYVLYDKLVEVCTIACEVLADSESFPKDWLMRHRWNKGKKAANVLPNGERIIHLKVGGRTSAVVPSVQKKTGPVAGDVSLGEVKNEAEEDEPIPRLTPDSVEFAKTMEVIEASGCKSMFDNVVRKCDIPLEVGYLRSTIHQVFDLRTLSVCFLTNEIRPTERL